MKNYSTSSNEIEELVVDSKFRVISSLPLENLDSGDLLVCLGEKQFTLNENTNPHEKKYPDVMLMGKLVLSQNSHSVVGIEVTESNGFNLTKDELKSAVHKKVGSIRVESKIDKIYLNYCCRAGTSANYDSPLTIPKNYGKLNVLHFNNKDMDNMKHYNSGNSSELISKLKITGAGKTNKQVVYSIELTEKLQENDVIMALCEYEVSNKSSKHVVSVCSNIVLSNEKHQVTGNQISEGNCTWVSDRKDMHHCQMSKNGTLMVGENDTESRYVNVVCWARSNGSEGEDLQIEQDYGRLSVIVFK